VDAPQVRLEGLRPATQYTVHVTAANRVGSSEPSDVLKVSTMEEQPSGHPRNIKVLMYPE